MTVEDLKWVLPLWILFWQNGPYFNTDLSIKTESNRNNPYNPKVAISVVVHTFLKILYVLTYS